MRMTDTVQEIHASLQDELDEQDGALSKFSVVPLVSRTSFKGKDMAQELPSITLSRLGPWATRGRAHSSASTMSYSAILPLSSMSYLSSDADTPGLVYDDDDDHTPSPESPDFPSGRYKLADRWRSSMGKMSKPSFMSIVERDELDKKYTNSLQLSNMQRPSLLFDHVDEMFPEDSPKNQGIVTFLAPRPKLRRSEPSEDLTVINSGRKNIWLSAARKNSYASSSLSPLSPLSELEALSLTSNYDVSLSLPAIPAEESKTTGPIAHMDDTVVNSRSPLGPPKLKKDDIILMEERTVLPDNIDDLLEKIVPHDNSLLQAPVKKSTNPLAPPPALLPKPPTEQDQQEIRQSLRVLVSDLLPRASAVAVDIVLERRRLIYLKTACIRQEDYPFSLPRKGAFAPVNEAAFWADPWTLNVRGHEELVQEAKTSAKRYARLRYGFPQISGPFECRDCSGEGSKRCDKCEGVEADVCFWCDGSGKQFYYGKNNSSCKRCNGIGHYPCSGCANSLKAECSNCEGKGAIISELNCIIECKKVQFPTLTVNVASIDDARRKIVPAVYNKLKIMYPNFVYTDGVDQLPTPLAPNSSQWCPVAAQCTLENFSSISVKVGKPTSMPSKKRPFGLASTKRTEPGIAWQEYVVSSSSRVPIRKVMHSFAVAASL